MTHELWALVGFELRKESLEILLQVRQNVTSNGTGCTTKTPGNRETVRLEEEGPKPNILIVDG